MTQPTWWLALVTTTLLVVIFTITIAANGQEREQHKLERVKFNVPKLLDFANFKRLFHKHYSSQLEELNRKRLFFTRAWRAFTSAVRYKFGIDSSYKRVNDMSDLTPGEVAQIENSEVMPSTSDDEIEATAQETQLGSSPQDAQVSSSPPDDFESRALAAALAMGAGDETSTQADRKLQHARKKRDVSEATPKPLVWHKIRELTPEEKAAGKVANPKFTKDEELKLQDSNYAPPDEVFIDHNQSNCLAEPRHQGRCGCCYAFSIVAIMEHRICLQTGGKLTPLSEQYLVDCGKGRYQDRLRGCNGGMVSAAGNFVHDFGLETRKRHPYRDAEGACPYRNLDSQPQQAGYVRMELGDAVHIHQDHWEEALERGGPLMVHAAIYTGMIEYGGGIDEALECRPKPSHEMVLVGHGRESGRHYWLIRNSYGLQWGERGHWRLDKRAASRCMGRYGEAFGTRDGVHFTARARLTKAAAA